MASRGVKTKEGELLDDENLDKVTALLNASDPITKKEACKILNISYNTTRLAKILEQHEERKAQIKRIRAKKRGTSATPMELQGILVDYLKGESITELSKQNYRSTGFIKGILRKYNVPLRSKATDYFNPEMIPDGALKEDYAKDEICWSARYNTMAQVVGHVATEKKFEHFNSDGLYETHPEHGKVYRLWVFGDHCRYAYQPWYELGNLEHLTELGVNLTEHSASMV